MNIYYLDMVRKFMNILLSRYGREVYVRSRKEIIVSAGTVNTPKLLMLSGIGPAEHLQKIGIKVNK